MTKNIMRALAPVTLALILAGCGGTGSGASPGRGLPLTARTPARGTHWIR